MSVSKSRIEIKSEQNECGQVRTFISFDGNRIKGVRSFSLKQDLDTGFPILTIDINAFDLSLDVPLVKVIQAGMGEIESIKFKNGNVINNSKEEET